MTYLRSLLRDLLDLRLWPVAALFVAALVIVPLLPSPDGPTARAEVATRPATTTTADPEEAAVAAEVGPVPTTATTPRTSDRPGDLHDPFAAQPAAASALVSADLPTLSATPSGGSSSSSTGDGAASKAGTGTSGASSSSSTSASAPTAIRPSPSTTTDAAPAATTPATTATTPATTTQATPATAVATAAVPASSSVRVTLRVRAVGGSAATTLRDPARLTVLPSPAVPAAVMLGALADGGVVFMLDRTTTSWGDGTCPLSHSGCPALVLHEGQTQLLDLPGADGTVRRSALTVVSVRRVTADDAAEAARLRERRSVPGLELVRDGIEAGNSALAAYRYDAERGIVVSDPALLAKTGTP